MQSELNGCTRAAIAGLGLSELEKLLQEHSDIEPFRAKQIYGWIAKGASCFREMKNIPKALQNILTKDFNFFSCDVQTANTGGNAQKIVLKLNDGCKIESVLLEDGKNRMTACLSTQAGCPAGCVFCKTGSVKFARNLDYTEIVEQYLHLRQRAGKSEINTKHIIDNIVVMGMGEPLLNLCNLRKAVSVFNDPKGLNFSLRRITVSTCGIAEGLFDIARNGPFFRLALSLPTADESLRNKLMPVTIKNPLSKIKEALAMYQQKGGGRVTLEVVLLGGVNTHGKDALSIAKFAEGLNAVVNLIPWNPIDDFKFEGKLLTRPEKKEIENFTAMLEKNSVKVTTRLHKGRSVMGACGQLG
ncbi:MAG: 23S rRNA (adenine(2503)-C(2))-methyltransferase RlmN [Treponema sp.]|nr:23S rRNA (adenine(2503)-C(2))-methyltransferase RlmN [Treponema sp.]